MKSSTKVIIGVVIVALIGAGVYFGGGTDLFKGSLQGINKNITRAQLAELIVTTLSPVISPDEISNLSEECVTDIAGMLEATSICYLINHDIFSTFNDGSFKPNNIINRAEAALVFNKAFKQYLSPLVTTTEYKPYSDVSKTDWFGVPVASLAAHDVLDVKAGAGNKFYPGNSLTNGRAQYWIKKIKEKSEIL